MSTTGEQLLKSFDLLPEPEKHQVASEITVVRWLPIPSSMKSNWQPFMPNLRKRIASWQRKEWRTTKEV